MPSAPAASAALAASASKVCVTSAVLSDICSVSLATPAGTPHRLPPARAYR